MKNIISFLIILILLSVNTFAQDAEFCKQVNSLIEKLFLDPVSLHGQDKRYENNELGSMITSTPTIKLQDAYSCEMDTFIYKPTSEIITGSSFDYSCMWPQNSDVSLDETIQQASELATGIAGCTGTKSTKRNSNSGSVLAAFQGAIKKLGKEPIKFSVSARNNPKLRYMKTGISLGFSSSNIIFKEK